MILDFYWYYFITITVFQDLIVRMVLWFHILIGLILFLYFYFYYQYHSDYSDPVSKTFILMGIFVFSFFARLFILVSVLIFLFERPQ